VEMESEEMELTEEQLKELEREIDEAWDYYNKVYKSMDMSTFNMCPLLEPAWRRAAKLSNRYKALTGKTYLGK